ncbi:hypothetical protein RE6C_00713 [Rhodopirellula europaea 6C]|uniref:Uncharacterized protein n=1 Tax=Rhodopirellula europaea 6C TaxID=1263867 RepID=M2AN63_9BACT|nr:hypothetical protein RE6C_00713 [Rhodopirellula europaea 6C]
MTPPHPFVKFITQNLNIYSSLSFTQNSSRWNSDAAADDSSTLHLNAKRQASPGIAADKTSS